MAGAGWDYDDWLEMLARETDDAEPPEESDPAFELDALDADRMEAQDAEYEYRTTEGAEA